MKKRIPAALAVAGLILSLFSGCSGTQTVSNIPASSENLSVSSQVVPSDPGKISKLEALPTLKITASDWVYMADKRGWFKEAFEDKGIEVELVQGILGNEAQLIARGDLHFANRTLYPRLFYHSQGADPTVVQVSNHPEPKIVSIIVPKDSPIKTFDDLKGKKIASWRAGCPHMALYELAEDKDWKKGTDWTYVNIPSSESKTVPISKQVDAISAHPPIDIATMLPDGSGREIANPAEDSVYINGGGITITLTSSEFAEKCPNIPKTYLALQDKTEQWMLQNLDEASIIAEGVSRVPANIPKFAQDRMGTAWGSNIDLKETEFETKTMQDWPVAHGDIMFDRQVEVSKLFASQYFDQ